MKKKYVVTLTAEDGAEGVPVPEDSEVNRIAINCIRFPRMGAAAVRNALVAKTQSDTEVLVLGNDDARPEPDMVQCHRNSILSLPERSLVLGASPWERCENRTIFDTLIDDTPMIFMYCHMRPHIWYDFRTAYTLNLSVRRKDFVEAGGFHERIRPYGYEDLAFACRLMGPDIKGIWYQPEAKVVHRHPMTPEDYLFREELLGMVAPVVAKECPSAFSRLLPNRSIRQIEDDFRQQICFGHSVRVQIFRWLTECCRVSHTLLGEAEERKQRIINLYRLHLPLKLHVFRLGFLRGLELVDDVHWQMREPLGLWRNGLEPPLTETGKERTQIPF